MHGHANENQNLTQTPKAKKKANSIAKQLVTKLFNKFNGKKVSCNDDLSKLSYNNGTHVMVLIHDEMVPCVIFDIKMVHQSPSMDDEIMVQFENGKKHKFRRDELRSHPNYINNKRKLCPGSTIIIEYESQLIPAYIYSWGNSTNKKQFWVMFENKQNIKRVQFTRYSHEIRCCKSLLQLRKNSNIFVFDVDINQWCYGKIDIIIEPIDNNKKWLDLNIYCVYYRKNDKIYSKYVHEFSASIGLMCKSVNKKYLINADDIKNAKQIDEKCTDLTDLKYCRILLQGFITREIIDTNVVYTDIFSIVISYIGVYGLTMIAEFATYLKAIAKKRVNMTPKEHTIHNGKTAHSIYETGVLLPRHSNTSTTLNVNANPFVPSNGTRLTETKCGNQRKKQPIDSYRTIPVQNSQKRVRIPFELTDTIHKYTTENIIDMYYYMSMMNTLQFINDRNRNTCNYNDVKIFNYNLHCKNTNDILYGVAITECSRNYEWRMLDTLFCGKDILEKYPKISLPQCILSIFPNIQRNKIKITSILSNKFTFEQIITKYTKWCKIKVYHQKNNKDRMPFKPTQEHFIQKCIEFIDKQNDINLIPIPMIYDNNTYAIEYLYIIQIPKKNIIIDIALALKYNNNRKYKVEICGIHINKECVLKQHEIIHSNCQCLNHFNESIIDDLTIGNPDDEKNIIKNLKKTLKGLKNRK